MSVSAMCAAVCVGSAAVAAAVCSPQISCWLKAPKRDLSVVRRTAMQLLSSLCACLRRWLVCVPLCSARSDRQLLAEGRAQCRGSTLERRQLD